MESNPWDQLEACNVSPDMKALGGQVIAFFQRQHKGYTINVETLEGVPELVDLGNYYNQVCVSVEKPNSNLAACICTPRTDEIVDPLEVTTYEGSFHSEHSMFLEDLPSVVNWLEFPSQWTKNEHTLYCLKLDPAIKVSKDIFTLTGLVISYLERKGDFNIAISGTTAPPYRLCLEINNKYCSLDLWTPESGDYRDKLEVCYEEPDGTYREAEYYLDELDAVVTWLENPPYWIKEAQYTEEDNKYYLEYIERHWVADITTCSQLKKVTKFPSPYSDYRDCMANYKFYYSECYQTAYNYLDS